MGIDYTHKKYGGDWGGNLISRPGKTKFREIKKGPQTGQTKMEKTKVHGTFKESGPPGTNLKLHKKSSKRLNEIMRLKEKKRQTRTGPGTEKARKKRLSHLQKGNYKTGGRAGYQGGGRTNLLEELGRVEAEPSNRNRRAEISRVHGELNRGYKDGKRVGLKHGTRGPHGFGPKPFLNKPGQAQGTHGGKIVKASDKAIKGNKLTKKA